MKEMFYFVAADKLGRDEELEMRNPYDRRTRIEKSGDNFLILINVLLSAFIIYLLIKRYM